MTTEDERKKNREYMRARRAAQNNGIWNPAKEIARQETMTANQIWPQYSIEQLRDFRERWAEHRRRANRMQIVFRLTFHEWLKIWIDSDHLENRGRRGQFAYVMSRFGDKGGYEIGNVEIKTHAENMAEGNRLKPRTGPRPNQSLAMKGRPKTPEHRAALREAALTRWAHTKGSPLPSAS